MLNFLFNTKAKKAKALAIKKANAKRNVYAPNYGAKPFPSTHTQW